MPSLATGFGAGGSDLQTMLMPEGMMAKLIICFPVHKGFGAMIAGTVPSRLGARNKIFCTVAQSMKQSVNRHTN